MIIDTSAIVAIILGEADAADHAAAIVHAADRRMSAASWLEAAMVVDRKGDAHARAVFDQFETKFGITVEPLTRAQTVLAREAWRRYGRGSGHKAQLNFGDCMTYALARESGEPLLFKGNDFIHTDITPALRD